MENNTSLFDLILEKEKNNAERELKEFKEELMQAKELKHWQIYNIIRIGITNKKQLRNYYERGLLNKTQGFGKVSLNSVAVYLGMKDFPEEICEEDVAKHKKKLKSIRAKIKKLSSEAKMINELISFSKRKKSRISVLEKNEKDKEIINRFIEGKSMAEIARQEEVSATRIRQRIYKAWRNNYPEHYQKNRQDGVSSLRKIKI